MKTYMESSLGEEEKKEKIREMLDTGWEIVRSIPNEPVYQCCVNTELNNTNFLVDEKGYTYLVDWENRYMPIRRRTSDIFWHRQRHSGRRMCC